MSQENLDLVRSIYADWERGDFTRADWANPQIEFVIVGGADPGQWTGVGAMTDAWRAWLGSWSAYRGVGETFREVDGRRVLVLIRGVGRGKASGVEVELRNANLFEVRDGKVSRLVLYSDCDQAFADLDLEA